MTKQEEIYGPLLDDFCLKIKKYYKKIDIPGLFLANVMPNYSNSKIKYFYIGQDTYYWTDFDNMVDLCASNNAKNYIKTNNKWLSPKNIISQSSNNAGSFWTMVIRLHIYLSQNEFVNVNQLTNEQKELLKTIGWGNLNSIELPESLKKEERWEGINENHYWDIKNKSEVFDKIKLIFEIYDPDIIFIFNWCSDSKAEQALEGLDVKFNKDTFIQNIISTYDVKGTNKKIIWSSHPNNLKWQGTNINNAIKIIYETYKKIIT